MYCRSQCTWEKGAVWRLCTILGRQLPEENCLESHDPANTAGRESFGHGIQVENHPILPSAIKGGTMNNITRIMMVGAGIGVVAVATPPMTSAWHQNEFSISSTGVPIVMVLNQDQLKGKWKQFKGDLKKKWGNFTDDDLLYIEGNRDKLEGKIQERYGDRKDEVRKWIDEWFEQNKVSDKVTP